MERFDCERCGVNVAYHGWPCIAAQINERESERRLIGTPAKDCGEDEVEDDERTHIGPWT